VDDPPAYIETVTVHTETGGDDQQFLLVNNVATLVWLAQMADLALHTSLARVSPEPDGFHLPRDYAGSREAVEASLLNYPDFVLFDLDPYIYRGDEKKGDEPELNRRAFETTCEVARWLKELLDSAGMSSFVKTSGATGLHIYVPVLRQYEYDVIREVAHTLGGFLVKSHPKEVTTEWVSEKRRGKVFFDANQNARIKNLACAYSPRTKPGAPVSIPLRWDELGKVYPTEFTILNAHERVAKVGDLWEHILDAKHDLTALLG
jgi:bifunctional non-homologous end joining protein LigD